MTRIFILLLAVLFAPLSQAADLGKPRILAIGDSLTEGYGVASETAYPAVLQTKLRANGLPNAVVVNAGTSGATTGFGLKTLRFHLKKAKPDLVILALGANDGLRGLKTEDSEKNLQVTIEAALAAGCRILLVGMQAPPNYGQKFPKDFAAIYPRLAAKYKIPLFPFLLDGVAGNAKLNQADGIHPKPDGYQIVAQNLIKPIKEALP